MFLSVSVCEVEKMVHCCVPLCTSDSAKKQENVTFHSFPSECSLREKWRQAISRQGDKVGSLWVPNNYSKVCSLHFNQSDFSISTSVKRILPNKVPSVFTVYPVHKQKIVKRRKDPATRNDVLPSKLSKIFDSDNYKHAIPSTSNCSMSATNEKGVQVSFLCQGRGTGNSVKCKYILMRKSNARLRKTVFKLRSRIREIKSEKSINVSELHQKVNQIEKNGKNGNLGALFLLEQIESYGKKKVKYGETTLKVCVLWHRKAPTGYRFLRSLHCLTLPHPKTLKNYIGFSNGETGITSLTKQRLQYECQNIRHAEEKLGSLIIDEMAIKPKVIYDRNLDQFIGYSEAELEEAGRSDKLANRLLCFLFRGLSTPFRIPVAFYFTRQLTGSQLYTLTLKVISEVEETGFQVLRIVTDNSSVNVNMMKELCGGTLMPEIVHPNDETRPLFLSFDSSHLLKNIRSHFLQKDFYHNKAQISSSHVKQLYGMQKGSTVKFVRGLTRKVIFPSNLEKMNVQRAKQLFSISVTAALKTLPIVAPEKVSDLEGLQKTIEFLEVIRKWHDIHDVCNTKQSYMSKNTDKSVFTESDDERLEWLTETFLPYMESIQKAEKKVNRISQETYDALVTTTESTVKCIKYLFSVGFHYILSRNLSSDDIELLFSHLRRRGGFNDMMDVRSTMYAIETTLKTGMINPSDSTNVERQTFNCLNSLRQYSVKQDVGQITCTPLPNEVLLLLDEPLEELPVTMELVSLAMIAGYLVRVAEEHTHCETCLQGLSSATSDSPLTHLIRMQDGGALRYPSRKFVYFLRNILKFTCSALRYLGKTNLVKKLTIYVVPKFLQRFNCVSCCDQERLGKIIMTKFLKPILDNHAKEICDQDDAFKNFRTKPLNRKVLKL